jgi:hypothetical protein
MHRRYIDDHPEQVQGFSMELSAPNPKRSDTEPGTRLIIASTPEEVGAVMEAAMLSLEEIAQEAFYVTVADKRFAILPEEHGLVAYFKTNATIHASAIQHFASLCGDCTIDRDRPLEGNYFVFPEAIFLTLVNNALRDARQVAGDPPLQETVFYVRCQLPSGSVERKRLEELPDEVRAAKRRITLQLSCASVGLCEKPVWTSAEHLLGVIFPGLPVFDMLSLKTEADGRHMIVFPTVPPVKLREHFGKEGAEKRLAQKKMPSYDRLITQFIAGDLQFAQPHKP